MNWTFAHHLDRPMGQMEKSKGDGCACIVPLNYYFIFEPEPE
ncbi:hypothetical protein [Bacillus sp. FJAT-27231]|nr:hypothetical protein [Bacillus sp. FJAT-27231]